MTQQALIVAVSVFAGFAAAALAWAVPDMAAIAAAGLARLRARRKLKADAAALLEQAADRPKRGGAAS